MRTPVASAQNRASLPRRRFLGRVLAALAGAALPWRARSTEAAVQSDVPYLGEIMLIPWNFQPRGWLFCNGQLLPINQNQALFSILGTTYGGNGQTTFALPDLRGRVAIHYSQDHSLGERSGETAHTLTVAELPAHTHVARCSSAPGISAAPGPGVVPARNPAQIPEWGASANAVMSGAAIAAAGGNQAHNNMQPFLTLNYVIAIQGVFPSR